MKKDKTKVLNFRLIFTLPDDFEGDENDALEEVLRYRRRKRDQVEQIPANPDLENIDLWSEWWKLPEHQKLIATYSLSEYDLASNTFKDLVISVQE